MKILAIRNSALGDVAMTLPVLYCVAHQYPDSEFYLLTRPFFAKIFINRPPNLHIIEADYKKEYHGAKGLMKLIKHLDTYHFDAVADLHNILRSWTIDTWMRCKGVRVAMVDKKRSKRIGNRLHQQQESFIDRYADVFARLGFPVSLDFTSIYETIPQTPIEVKHPAVGIAPFARYDNKTYPLHLMERVVDMLTKQGVNVYLFGARGEEADILQKWSDAHPNCVSVAGKTDITGELAIMANLDVMVTMDSANHHLASLTGTPVISIWGSTTPACGFQGYGQTGQNAMVADIECQPCTVAGSDRCPKGTLQCMTALLPSSIAQKIISTLPSP